MQKRMFLLLATLPLILPASELAAQPAFPSRPIEVVIPFPPGGPTDTAPRILLEHLRSLLKATMVPISKVGAGGAIGVEYVHRSMPDGHTILATSNPALSVKTAIDKKVPYKIEDFAAIGMYATDVGILAARRELGIKTIDDLIARAKKNPDELSYASAGQGTVSHVSAELFKTATDVKILHVPHRGSGPAVQAVLGGHVPLISAAFSSIAPLIEFRRPGAAHHDCSPAAARPPRCADFCGAGPCRRNAQHLDGLFCAGANAAADRADARGRRRQGRDRSGGDRASSPARA